MFMTTTFIPVSRLLTADQPPLFHEPISKPASSPDCHVAILLASVEPWLMPCNSITKLRNTARLVFQNDFPVSVAAAINPKHMAECDHRIMRSEFSDYRELFRESDIRSAVAFLRNSRFTHIIQDLAGESNQLILAFF